MFSASRSTRLVFGITAAPRCTFHRSEICPGDLPCASAIVRIVCSASRSSSSAAIPSGT
ncbi:hypothetical protein DSM3645_15895 [Blastopirellula marina DSM 3645]|uniref:Uncharacterized protein n=1 Tax=Blastopirellula marina DSM 3645 TaxID=314230 RepID=A4A286_9BACT|nr:hypothetical protein DSM3645_15895 [Blastopirellula marina DSM 3645]